MWARRAGKAGKAGSGGKEQAASVGAAAKSAADRVINALKDPSNKYRPDFDEKTKQALYTICSKRNARWMDLHEMRHDTTYMEEIHADIMKEHK